MKRTPRQTLLPFGRKADPPPVARPRGFLLNRAMRGIPWALRRTYSDSTKVVAATQWFEPKQSGVRANAFRNCKCAILPVI